MLIIGMAPTLKKKLKTSAFSRTFSLLRLGTAAGVNYLSSHLSQTTDNELLIKQSKALVGEIGKLKGSIQKAGQLLSIYGEHFLPPDVNTILKSLQSDSDALDWPVIYSILCEYFDEERLDELIIEQTPIACASLGQVHRATIKKTGEKIALKIRYPDVEKTIESDLAILKRIIQISNILPNGIDLNVILNEMKMMLEQEVNYESEAASTIFYKDLLNSDSRYLVPKLYSRYSNSAIIATQYIEALRPDHPLVLGLSQNRRNAIAENFLELYLKEIFTWNYVQTDPHLGNYKILISSTTGIDQIVLLDFGACKRYSTDFITDYKALITGAILNNDDLFFAGAKKLGFVLSSDTELYRSTFKEFCHSTVEPFFLSDDPRNLKLKQKVAPDGTYDWKNSDLPQRIVKQAFKFREFNLRTPPSDLMFLDRKTVGVFTFLSTLNANIASRNVINPFIAEFHKNSYS